MEEMKEEKGINCINDAIKQGTWNKLTKKEI